jgi:hypothetical protein
MSPSNVQQLSNIIGSEGQSPWFMDAGVLGDPLRNGLRMSFDSQPSFATRVRFAHAKANG